MNEFAPAWSNPKMTKAQVKKYIKNMKEKQEEARKKIEEAEKSWEFKKEQDQLEELENKIDNL